MMDGNGDHAHSRQVLNNWDLAYFCQLLNALGVNDIVMKLLVTEATFWRWWWDWKVEELLMLEKYWPSSDRIGRSTKWNIIYWDYFCYRPPLSSSSQSFWLITQRSRVRFPALPDFLSSSGSGTGPLGPYESKWGATWKKSSGSGLENWD
jgi:hypothetical protein